MRVTTQVAFQMSTNIKRDEGSPKEEQSSLSPQRPDRLCRAGRE